MPYAVKLSLALRYCVETVEEIKKLLSLDFINSLSLAKLDIVFKDLFLSDKQYDVRTLEILKHINSLRPDIIFDRLQTLRSKAIDNRKPRTLIYLLRLSVPYATITGRIPDNALMHSKSECINCRCRDDRVCRKPTTDTTCAKVLIDRGMRYVGKETPKWYLDFLQELYDARRACYAILSLKRLKSPIVNGQDELQMIARCLWSRRFTL